MRAQQSYYGVNMLSKAPELWSQGVSIVFRMPGQEELGAGPPPFVGSFEDAPSSSYADAQRMHHQICSASDRIAGVFLSMVEP